MSVFQWGNTLFGVGLFVSCYLTYAQFGLALLTREQRLEIVRSTLCRHNRLVESVIRTSMDLFPITFTLVAEYFYRHRSVCIKDAVESTQHWRRVSSCDIACNICCSVNIFLGSFCEGSWLACLRNPTRAGSEGELPSSASLLRLMTSKRDSIRFRFSHNNFV